MNLIRQWTQSTFFKVFVLLFVLVLLSIALGSISDVVYERKNSQRYAEEELAQTHVGAQGFVSPVLVIPYIEEWDEINRNSVGKEISRTTRRKLHTLPVMANSITIDGSLTPEARYRGIFEVQFYQAALNVTGSYPAVHPSQFKKTHDNATITKGQPYLTLNLSDIRGLQGQPTTTVNNTPLTFLPGKNGSARRHAFQPRHTANNRINNRTDDNTSHTTEKAMYEAEAALMAVAEAVTEKAPEDSKNDLLNNSLHAPLTGQALQDYQNRQPLTLSMNVRFAGQKSLFFAPVADETTVQLQSNWQHPSFAGSFLPASRNVSDAGFTSTWNISSLVTTGNLLSDEADNKFGVHLIQPINTYSLSERAVKYGFLFVALTLLVVFMVELFRKLQLHPMQYGLVGLSISFFFLLLLALSEKIGFAMAYLTAGSATVLLLGIYFSAILKHWMHGLGMAGFVALLYGALYGLLKSEDNALLLGTLLLFGLLAGLMLMTRNVDWYALTKRENGKDRADTNAVAE